jgi:hypothetical protein
MFFIFRGLLILLNNASVINPNKLKDMNLKLTFLVVLCLTNFSIILGQLSVKIVNDDFNSNLMRWDEKSNDISEMKLEGGKYLISCKKESTAITSTIEVPHLQYSDYRISATLSKLKGIDDNGFGLVWGGKDENNELEFVISGNGQFKVMKWEGGIKTDLVPWTYSTAINKWDFSSNVLIIENKDKVLRYYINNEYVAATNDISQLGNRVGFVLNETMQVEVDNLVVENLAPGFEKKLGSPDNVKISSIKFSGNRPSDDVHSNELYYNETANIQVELTNIGNETVKDLAIHVEANEQLLNVDYTPITMVEEIPAQGSKTVQIKLSADEDVSDNNYTLNIKLSGINGNTVDNEVMALKTIGLSSYYANKDTETTEKNTTTNPYYNTSDDKILIQITTTAAMPVLKVVQGLVFWHC